MDRRLTSAVPAAPPVRAPSPASPRSPPPRRRVMRGNARTRPRARQRGNRGTPGARAARGGQEQQRGTGAGRTSLAARVLSSAPGGVGGPHRATRHVDPGATRPRGPASRRRHAGCVGGPSRHGTPPPCLWPRAVRPLPQARILPRTPRGRLRVFRACTSSCLGWASMTLSTALLSIAQHGTDLAIQSYRTSLRGDLLSPGHDRVASSHGRARCGSLGRSGRQRLPPGLLH